MTERAVIVHAGPTDLDAILALERDGFDAASRWSAQSWREELTGADRCVLVAPGAAGEGGLLGVATLQLVAEVADLHRVVVAPDRRGRGIGRGLVEAGLAWAAGRGACRVLLEVEHDNVPALALYHRLGFTELARRTDYYGVGRHALVLCRAIADEVGRASDAATSDAVGSGDVANDAVAGDGLAKDGVTKDGAVGMGESA